MSPQPLGQDYCWGRAVQPRGSHSFWALLAASGGRGETISLPVTTGVGAFFALLTAAQVRGGLWGVPVIPIRSNWEGPG